jgi:hypothetical protein
MPVRDTTLVAPTRSGTEVAASKARTWDALLAAWAANQEMLGAITYTDASAGLVLASLSWRARRPVADDLDTWGTCTSTIFTELADSVTWTVVVRGDTDASAIHATARFWKLGYQCVSHGVREAELEALVKEMAEGERG